MIAPAGSIAERRDDPRVTVLSAARLQAPSSLFPQQAPAVIEEMSACGLRLRTETQLHRDQALVLQVRGEALPLHARCVWVKEGPRPRSGVHPSWVAGCRLEPDSIARTRLPVGAAERASRFTEIASRLLAVGGVIALLAILVFLYIRFATILGGSAHGMGIRQ